MSTIDLHPEDLIDKEIAGELSPDEEDRLLAHVSECDACRFERAARGDFREEFVVESQRRKLAGMVANVMLARVDQKPVPKKFAAPSRTVRTAIMVAAAMLIVGVATATQWSTIRRAMEPARSGEEPTLVVATARTVSTQTPSVPATIEPVVAPPEAVVAAPSVSAVVVAQAPAAEKTPAVLFAQANDARARGDYSAAMDGYSQLEGRYASTPEGNLSRVILGRLMLDRGDPNGALERFDAYLHSGDDTLREEAMVGRAAALEAVGRREDAAAAWSAFLDTYPGSVHAPRAKSRLGALRP